MTQGKREVFFKEHDGFVRCGVVELSSAVMDTPDWCMEYRIGETSRAGVGPLFAWDGRRKLSGYEECCEVHGMDWLTTGWLSVGTGVRWSPENTLLEGPLRERQAAERSTSWIDKPIRLPCPWRIDKLRLFWRAVKERDRSLLDMAVEGTGSIELYRDAVLLSEYTPARVFIYSLEEYPGYEVCTPQKLWRFFDPDTRKWKSCSRQTVCRFVNKLKKECGE